MDGVGGPPSGLRAAPFPPSGPPVPAPRRVSRRAVAAGAAALAFAAAFGWFVPVPQILLLRVRDPRSTAFIEARRERLRAEGKGDAIRRTPVPLGSVSPHLVRAVVVAEDGNFWTHGGVDWDAVRRAREWNERQRGRKRPRLRGASTITQQLAKNLWLSAERSLWRKAREAAIALALDALVPKGRILEVYLSSIEFGERVYGVEAAAHAYFSTDAARLGREQAAWLAAMIPGPRVYLASPARHARRQAKILRLMSLSGPVERPAPEEDERSIESPPP